MPVAVSQTAGQAGGGVASLTTGSVTPGGSDRYVMAVSASRGDGPLTARYDGSGGTLLTADTQRTISFTGGRGRTFRVVGGPTASTTGYATYDGDAGDIATTAVSFMFLTGVDQTTPAGTVQTVEDVNGDSVTTVTATLAMTGLGAGQFVAAALELSEFNTSAGMSAITSNNGATTVREARYGTYNSGNSTSVATAWLTGTADGSGNLTLSVTVTKTTASIVGWWIEGYPLNEAAGGGGSTYNESTSETATLVDSQTGLLVMAGAANESLPLVDSQAAAAVRAGAASESLPLAEAQDAATARAGAANESLPLADTQAAQAVFVGATSESLPLADTSSGTAVFPAATSESLPLADTSTGGLLSTGAASELLPLADTQAAAAVRAGAASESLPLADTQVAQAALVGAASESLPLSEAQSAIVVYVVAATETISLADEQDAIVVPAGQVLVEEALAFADTVSATVSYAVSVNESLILVDTTNASGGRLIELAAEVPLPAVNPRARQRDETKRPVRRREFQSLREGADYTFKELRQEESRQHHEEQQIIELCTILLMSGFFDHGRYQ